MTDFETEEPQGDWTVNELRRHNRFKARNGGTTCAGCGGHVEVYERLLNTSLTAHLVLAYSLYGEGVPFHSKRMLEEHGRGLPINRDPTGAKAWGVIEAVSRRREDGGHRGMWIVTTKGAQFVRGEIRLPAKHIEYQGKSLGFSAEHVSVDEVISGVGFDLRQIRSRDSVS